MGVIFFFRVWGLSFLSVLRGLAGVPSYGYCLYDTQKQATPHTEDYTPAHK